MPAGRPRLYTSEEEVQAAPDGRVCFTGDKLSNKDFKKEKDLSEFIEANIESFCEQLGARYISHEIDMDINKRQRRAPRGRRVDLFIEADGVDYIVELKNPRFGTESRAAIGQLLDYGREFTDSRKKELVLISTAFDVHTARTIKHYGLPIRYIYFCRRAMMEFLGEQDRKAA